MTAEEFIQRHGGDHAELVKGQVRLMPPLFLKQGRICARIGFSLYDHVEKHDIGHVMSNDSFVQTRSNPDTIRGADICYFSYELLPKGKVPEGLLPVQPDLIVEVRS